MSGTWTFPLGTHWVYFIYLFSLESDVCLVQLVVFSCVGDQLRPGRDVPSADPLVRSYSPQVGSGRAPCKQVIDLSHLKETVFTLNREE